MPVEPFSALVSVEAIEGSRRMLRPDGSKLWPEIGPQKRQRRPKTFEGLQVDSELLKDSVKQRRPDVTPAMNRNSRRPAILV
jgi:hypothetical protein